MRTQSCPWSRRYKRSSLISRRPRRQAAAAAVTGCGHAAEAGAARRCSGATVIGAEGGLAPSEYQAAAVSGFEPVSLGAAHPAHRNGAGRGAAQRCCRCCGATSSADAAARLRVHHARRVVYSFRLRDSFRALPAHAEFFHQRVDRRNHNQRSVWWMKPSRRTIGAAMRRMTLNRCRCPR